MRRLLKVLPVMWLIVIVTFVNYNCSDYQKIWDLGYYTQYYLIVFAFCWFMWNTFEDKLTRSLIAPIAIYYVFHLFVQILDIFNPELKSIVYSGKWINYGLCVLLALALIISACIRKRK